MAETKINFRKNVAILLKTLALKESHDRSVELNPETLSVQDDPTNPYAFRVSIENGNEKKEFRILVKETD